MPITFLCECLNAVTEREGDSHYSKRRCEEIECRRLDRSVSVKQDGLRNGPKNCRCCNEQSVVSWLGSKWWRRNHRRRRGTISFVAVQAINYMSRNVEERLTSQLNPPPYTVLAPEGMGSRRQSNRGLRPPSSCRCKIREQAGTMDELVTYHTE